MTKKQATAQVSQAYDYFHGRRINLKTGEILPIESFDCPVAPFEHEVALIEQALPEAAFVQAEEPEDEEPD